MTPRALGFCDLAADEGEEIVRRAIGDLAVGDDHFGHRAPQLSPTGIVRNVIGAAEAALQHASAAASESEALAEKNAKFMAECPSPRALGELASPPAV